MLVVFKKGPRIKEITQKQRTCISSIRAERPTAENLSSSHKQRHSMASIWQLEELLLLTADFVFECKI
jgi:hypothetical protein